MTKAVSREEIKEFTKELYSKANGLDEYGYSLMVNTTQGDGVRELMRRVLEDLETIDEFANGYYNIEEADYE